jgi:hypothetical protein
MGRKREVPPTPKEMVFRLASPEATAKLMQDTFNDRSTTSYDYMLPVGSVKPMPRDLGAGSVGKLLISPKPSV